ncbi:hypothetical protein SLA2020_509350 [Shorea laevis]
MEFEPKPTSKRSQIFYYSFRNFPVKSTDALLQRDEIADWPSHGEVGAAGDGICWRRIGRWRGRKSAECSFHRLFFLFAD